MHKSLETHEQFQLELKEYLIEYTLVLGRKFKNPTANKHKAIIYIWIEYICNYESVSGFDQLKLSMVNSKFQQYFHAIEDQIGKREVSNVVVKFLLFIKDKYNISNTLLLNKLIKSE